MKEGYSVTIKERQAVIKKVLNAISNIEFQMFSKKITSRVSSLVFTLKINVGRSNNWKI